MSASSSTARFRRKGLRPRLLAMPAANRDSAISRSSKTPTASSRARTSSISTSRLAFTPSPAWLSLLCVDGGYDERPPPPAPALVALDDDDSRLVALPFAFPFFGALPRGLCQLRRQPHFHGAPDNAQHRPLARPYDRRSAAHLSTFDDLNPAETAGGVRVLSEAGRVVVSWVAVPEWVCLRDRRAPDVPGQALPRRPHRVRLQRREPASAVVGIAPGRLKDRPRSSITATTRSPLIPPRSPSASAAPSTSISSPSRSASTRRMRMPTITSSSSTTWTFPAEPRRRCLREHRSQPGRRLWGCRRATMARSTARRRASRPSSIWRS